jgi:3-hydroxyacyl-CoA dehydrogenase
MAKQIAALLYLGGNDVTIWNHRKVELSEVERQVRLLKKFISPLSEGAIHVVECFEDLEDHLTIESVVENLEIKRSLYDQLRKRITKGYYTNSSSYSPEEIGIGVSGLHFFNPITLKLVELYQADTSCKAIEEVVSYLTALDFEVVSVNNNRGYIGNYILFHEISSALKLVEIFNYTVDTVNVFYKKLYDGRDIFNIVDIIGIDVVRAIIVNLKEQDASLYLPESLEKALNSNILGKKNKTSIKQVLP